jgi:hypothetical protein
VNKILAAALTLFLAAAALAGLGREEAPDPLEPLVRLYKDCRFFELREAVAKLENNTSVEVEFFRGAVANSFNRLDLAVSGLLRYLDGASADAKRPLAKEAWVLLADCYRRLGQYRKSAGAQRTILKRYGAMLDAPEKANRVNQDVIWSALADVPSQTIEISGDSAIRMERRLLPVRVKDRIIYVAYDTGANLSVLYRSAADDLGLTLYGSSIKIQSATGKWIDSRMTVVPEMRLGEAVIRNAVFLVLPDDYFPPRRACPGVERRGLIGAPILAALKEITVTRDGFFLVPASPRPRPEHNMCFFGFMPVVEVLHRGARFSFCLDTGSSATFLYPPFFRRYRGEIRAHSKPRKTTMGGIGDERPVTIHVLNEFAFKAGGLDLALKRISVHTQVTHSSTELFFGTLGLDILAQCSRMTFNFESMSFILE